MKKDEFSKIIDEIVELKVRIADEFIKDVIEPLADIGNPEELIGKSYWAWTPQDLTMLVSIYGKGPNPLTKLIARRELERATKRKGENILSPEITWGRSR